VSQVTNGVRETMLDTSRNISLACALSALAGYVDGIGFSISAACSSLS